MRRVRIDSVIFRIRAQSRKPNFILPPVFTPGSALLVKMERPAHVRIRTTPTSTQVRRGCSGICSTTESMFVRSEMMFALGFSAILIFEYEWRPTLVLPCVSEKSQ